MDISPTVPPLKDFGLTASLLKWIAIVCMLADHIAWFFLPVESPLAILMHTVGRITSPIMFFFVAEGYFHTRSVPRYALRLLTFALISWPCFSLFSTGVPFSLSFGVIWSLLLGLLALWGCQKQQSILLRILIVTGCCLLSIPGDWPIFAVLYIVAIGMNRNNRKMQLFWYLIISSPLLLPAIWKIFGGDLSRLYEFGLLLPLPLLFLYNGKRGGKPWMKWVFYIFYPAHMLLLYLIGTWL